MQLHYLLVITVVRDVSTIFAVN